MKQLIVVVAAAMALSGCATRGAGFVPLVDNKGKEYSEITSNVQECQQFAQQQAGAGSGAVAGAVVGALLMAALAPGGRKNSWATEGAIVGGASGALGANESQENIIRRCLRGRGFSVLN